MPLWPFRKRRRSKANQSEIQTPMTEKAQAQQQPTRAATYPPAGPTQPIDIPQKSSTRNRDQSELAQESVRSVEGASGNPKQPRPIEEKENVAPASSHQRGSREDITALPMSRKLDSSPHLRPVDLERPHIPYNFRPYSNSQSSIQQEPKEMISTPRGPNKLRSRRSAYDSTPQSRKSSRRKPATDRVREEEIRAMGTHTPIPKRPGDSILRRDSKKARGYGNNRSYFSLPADDDNDSNLTSVMEQRGWEIGLLDVFNPRPAVRLSGTPQYVTPSSVASPSPIAEMVRKDKEKMPSSRDRPKMREPIGSRADDLDASDIRALMERDAKRRERKKKEQQEKLEQKLRNRNGRNRGDSDKRRREAEDARRAEEAAAEESRLRDLTTPPTDVHPALREATGAAAVGAVGLGIGESRRERDVEPEDKDAPPEEKVENPFTDAAAAGRTITPPVEQMPGAFSPVHTPLETPMVEEARQMEVTQTATPPLSPVSTTRAQSNLSQMLENRRASDIPQPPPPITDVRRQSDPKPDRRAGAWATFFRRGGTNLKKPGDARSPPSEASFSNTSRESMRNQPLPPHLVDTSVQTPRRKSATPVRTQSRFREDLPEMPASPPDSTMPSPDVTTAAAAAAAARRIGRSSAPVAVPEDTTMTDTESGTRNDTPVSPSMRPNRMASMASVDSEGSWLASSGKRHSTQSGINRSIGSLNQRFTGSYEELGGDKDAEYFRRTAAGSPDPKRTRATPYSGLGDNAPDEESDEDGNAPIETPGDPIAVHESVRRQPTLIHRDPRVKSREGLLTEYAADRPETPEPTSAGTGRGSLMGFEPDEPEPQLERAASVDYGKRHARQISSGSARLVGATSPRVATFSEEPMPSSQPSSSQ